MSIKQNTVTIDQLQKRIDELEKEVNELHKIKEDDNLVSFPWAGNLGQWNWNYELNKVVFNDKKVLSLGYDPREIGEIGFEFFTDKLHPDDYENVMTNMRHHLLGITEAYEVEYRIRHQDGHYLWYYDRGIITDRDQLGKPLMLHGIVFDITKSKEIEERLIYLSERDTLTRLFNRRVFFEHLRMQVEDTNNHPFSLIMYDIDHFKLINDRYGHHVGDQVLLELSKMIKHDIRKEDHAYRYGGEEFFIILPHTSHDQAIQISKRLHEKIQNIAFPEVNKITISMGVVTYQENETIDDVVKRVDDLLYDAKRAGRNTIKY